MDNKTPVTELKQSEQTNETRLEHLTNSFYQFKEKYKTLLLEIEKSIKGADNEIKRNH
jgi:hypothetical protein